MGIPGDMIGWLLFSNSTFLIRIASTVIIPPKSKASKFHAIKWTRKRGGTHVLFGVLIYEGVEPIDLATFGVLSMARRIRNDIEICTIAPSAGVTLLANGLKVIADYDLQSAPRLDVLIVTGGPAG